jgi:UDP-3-O-[3-hydroxymyristoyl] glucosamine N-acyltransferase
MTVQWTVQGLAERLGLEYHGEGSATLARAASLEAAGPDALGFFVPGTARGRLAATRAGAVVVCADDVMAAPCACLVSDEPYLHFARASQLLHPLPAVEPGIAPGATVASDASIDDRAQVANGAIVEAGARIEAGAVIGPACVIGANAWIGADTRLGARTVVGDRCVLGRRCIVQPGAVIGSDGFGFARDGDGWVRIPHIGRVVIGDDVAIGANTTIDRGTSDDTVIADGVILDNQIQIAHNVRIGRGTAMAGCVGVAGSAVIGARCTIGGAAAILGHLEIVDDVHITAMSMVSKSITLAGTWSSGVPLEPNRDWRRNAARFRQLDSLARRINALEKDRTEKKP